MQKLSLERLQEQIVDAITGRIEPLFKGNPIITVLVRFADNTEADVLVTSDTEQGIRGIVDRRFKQPAGPAEEGRAA